MLKRADNSGFASVSTFRTNARPARLFAALAISGATIRHGPHQAAQKSTSTGTDEADVTESKISAVGTSIGVDGWGIAVWHLPHFVGRSSESKRSRFVVPHDGHFINTPLPSRVIPT